MCKLNFNEISMPPIFKNNPEIISEFLRQALPVRWARKAPLGQAWQVVEKGGSALSTPSQGLMASGWAEMGFWTMNKGGGRLQQS